MQLKNSEYQILSDLFFAINEDPLHRKLVLQDYKSFDELYQMAGEVLDLVRDRQIKQNERKRKCTKK